jgi:tetratricopeptide (TPR) repeat protein
MSQRDEPYWLVKSSQRLIGPISANDILRRLKSREFNLNDETTSPGRRWQQIQVHPEFREVVDEMRRTLMSEETEVSWTPGNSTQTLTDFLDADLTEELTDKLGSFTRTGEIVVHELPVEPRPNAGSGSARFQADAFSRNPILQKKADRTARWLWLLTAAVLIAGLVIVWQKKTSSSNSRSVSLDTLRTQVPEVIQTGDFNEALNELKNYFPDPLQSGELGLYMGPLLIQLEGQTVVGKRILSQMLKNQQGDPKLELTAMGIADLIENQIDSARQNFDRALALDKDYVPAIINRGVADFQMGRYQEASAAAMKAIHINAGEGEAQLLLAESAVYLHQKTNATSEIQQAIIELNNYRAHHLDYDPEAIFYTIYLEWLKPGRNLSEDKLNEFLEMDPQLTADHRHNVFIYKGPAQWSLIGRFCQQMADQMEASARTSVLKAVCFSKEGRKLEARTWVEKAINQSPADALAQTWYSYVLNENGMGDQASVALGRAGELNRKDEHTLPILMQARFSQAAGDFEPAKQVWNHLYTLNDRSISALGGLALTHAALGSHKEAISYIDRGLSISPDYIPLLKLKLKARKEGWYGRS